MSDDLDRKALEMEDHFGVCSISLSFSDGKRAVIGFDVRPAIRDLKRCEAKLAEVDDAMRRARGRSR